MLYLPFGSPTIELFAASYNNRANKTNTIPIEVTEYGYVDYNASIPIQFEDNYGIYSKNNNAEWWIASPGTDFSDISLIYVNYINTHSYLASASHVNSNSENVRPIVCIPTSVFNSKYTLANE